MADELTDAVADVVISELLFEERVTELCQTDSRLRACLLGLLDDVFREAMLRRELGVPGTERSWF